MGIRVSEEGPQRYEGGGIDEPLFMVFAIAHRPLYAERGDDVLEVALAVEADAAPMMRLRNGQIWSIENDELRPHLAANRDRTVLDVLGRLWEHRRDLFSHRPPPRPLEQEGAFDISPADRDRLRAIVRKYHRRYFADHPTDAQVDQLIDSLGPTVAGKLVKGAIDKGHFG